MSTLQHWLGLLLLALFGVIISAGGIGGGGVYVTLLVVLCHKTLAEAVPLSKAMILAGSLASFIASITKKNKETGQSYCNWTLAKCFIPGSLMGTSIGIILNDVFPDYLLFILFSVVLCIVTFKTFRAWYHLRENEEFSFDTTTTSTIDEEDLSMCSSRSFSVYSPLNSPMVFSARRCNSLRDMGIAVLADSLYTSPISPVYLSSATRRQFFQPGSFMSYDSRSPTTMKRLLSPIDERTACDGDKWKPQTVKAGGLSRLMRSWSEQVLYTSATWIQQSKYFPVYPGFKYPIINRMVEALILLSVLGCAASGTIIYHSSLPTAQVCIIFAIFIVYVAVVAVSFLCQFLLSVDPSVFLCPAKQVHVDFVPWKIINIPIVSLFSGTLSGLLGIGGGMVTTPLFVSMELLPVSAISTAAVVMVFTSTATTLQFALAGRLALGDALPFGSISIVSSALGQLLLIHASERSRPSNVLLLVFLALLISTILTVTKAVNTSKEFWER